MLATSETALICDFAEYYHVLDWRGLPLKTVAALAAGLREDSRSMMALKNSKLTRDEVLKAIMVDRLSMLVWTKTKDAEHNRNRPKSILEMMMRPEQSAANNKAFNTAEEFEAARQRFLKGA